MIKTSPHPKLSISVRVDREIKDRLVREAERERRSSWSPTR
jgi:hypothetical protein